MAGVGHAGRLLDVLKCVQRGPVQRIWGTTICRHSNTLSGGLLESHRTSILSKEQEEKEEEPTVTAPPDFRYVYPEFLPEPDWKRRDRIKEKLERRDMYRRRAVVQIPEFYVGSILSVIVSDPHASGKKSRFVGICIQRGGHGLRAHMTLRNFVDGQGVEIMYELYNPLVQQIEVLKLEKRLDEELFYLRDAPAEYCTIPFDVEPVPHPPGTAVPVNQIKVKLGPRPWHERWERKDLQGIEPLELPERFFKRAEELSQPWEKYDLMKQYRASINEVETGEIMTEVHHNMTEIKRKQGRKRMTASVMRKT